MPSKPLSNSPLAVALAAVFLWCCPARAGDPTPTWEQLESRGAAIAGIDVKIINVFDKSQPESKYWFAHVADFIHIMTREEVVRGELLFKVGDHVDASKIHDTERALRYSLDIARDAYITPERVEGDKVWALVVFKDAWTLGLDLHYGHVGGQNRYTFRIHERNFLGFGKGLLLSYEHTFERNIEQVAYFDPQLFGSLWTLNMNYQKLSDGKARLFDVEKPFYSADTPWMVQMKVTDFLETLTLYNDTHSVYALRNHDTIANLSAAWAYHVEGTSAFRIGAGFVVSQMSYFDPVVYRPGYLPPLALQDHRLRGPEVTWELFQGGFQNFNNMASIGRSESFNLGWDVNAAAGIYSRSLGSAASGPFFSASVTKGWRVGDDTLLVQNGGVTGRREDGVWRGGLLSEEATVYNQSLPYQTLAGDVRVDLALRPDLENWLYLGGVDGMRGYPNHFEAGDRRWIASFEDRVITPWSLWGLAQVGFVGFLDAGAIHAFDTRGFGKTYSDVGMGLRFGNLKSRVSQVLVVAIAVPLVTTQETKHVQIVVGNVVRF